MDMVQKLLDAGGGNQSTVTQAESSGKQKTVVHHLSGHFRKLLNVIKAPGPDTQFGRSCRLWNASPCRLRELMNKSGAGAASLNT